MLSKKNDPAKFLVFIPWRKIPVIMAILMLGSGGLGFSQSSTKSGGVCFRVDNNPPIEKLNQFYSVFNRYQKKFTIGVTSWSLPLNIPYVNGLKYYISQGHEIMDNTPSHQTHYFLLLNAQDTILYSGNPGVDHCTGQQVCLKYTSVDTTQYHSEGFVNVAGNVVISAANGEFANLAGNPYYFALYFGFTGKPYLYYDLRNKVPSDPDTLKLKSFWNETVNLGNHSPVTYHKLTQRDVFMHPDAVRLLAERSLKIYSDLNMPHPTTWVHPAGQMPWINAYDVKRIMGDTLGFTAGSNYVNSGFFCYNEYNPLNVKQFCVQSGEITIEKQTFKWNKSQIAGFFAKHSVKVDLSYFVDPLGGWDAYLLRLDSLVKWCYLNKIPVLTYRTWSEILYDSVPNRVVNIFPKLNADLDTDGFPDGFDRGSSLQGIFRTSGGVSQSGGRCFEIPGTGNICQVTSLAGIEKGRNKFSIWVKRSEPDTSSVFVHFTFPETGSGTTLQFPVDSLFWIQKFQVLDVPENVSLVNVLVRNAGNNNDTVRISGLDLRSTGFLTETTYPPQDIPANEPFQSIDLNALVVDSLYDPASITWSIKGIHTLNLTIQPDRMLKIMKPVSFWVGKDSAYLVARNPDGLFDSCFVRFTSSVIPEACEGNPITLTLLDTLSGDIIRWTSSPLDPTISNPTVYNPTVNPKVPTMYRVECINPMGNINRDSVFVIRHPNPAHSILNDTTICAGDSIRLTASGGVQYLWSTGDTTATVMVKPPATTLYTVQVTNQAGCSITDSVVISVSAIPVAKIYGLAPVYCSGDEPATLTGTPEGGTFQATSGLIGNQFYPNLADTGMSKVWYTYTNPAGCSDTDTAYVLVNPNPARTLPPQSGMCRGDSLLLVVSGGVQYLWSTGATTPEIIVKPSGDSTFSVVVTSEYGCSTKDSTLVVVTDKPAAKLYGLLQTYCQNDYAATLYGLPPGGTIGATSGLEGNRFYPSIADTGLNKVWYTYTNTFGCSNTDTVLVTVFPVPVILPQPDTILCGGRTITLHAGPGFDNYQWSNGSTDSVTTIDSVGHGLTRFYVYIYVTKHGCASKSMAKIKFMPCPGFEEQQSDAAFRIYPNPADAEIIVENREHVAGSWDCRIIDFRGSTVLRRTLDNQIQKIDLSGFASGIYMITLSGEGRTLRYKFIKE